ncbi:MAG: hypothetical protein O7A09_03185 [Proteobacteria bacterium]|nr:hypothetical protein [Pseudomonadota bacterium]MCZ6783099.1 hypothetical protein [Pseudomonadota bacterium]
MLVTRLYTGSDGESHFEDVDIELRDLGEIGSISELLPATGVVFRTTGPDYDYAWHNAPRRQYVVMLSGGDVEIEVGDGTVRRFSPGDVLLAEDTHGRGHVSRAVDGRERTSLFITLD